MRHDAAELRKIRIHAMAKEIAKGITTGVDHEKLLTEFEYDTGLRRKTLENDLNAICRKHDWVIKSGVIKLAEVEE